MPLSTQVRIPPTAPLLLALIALVPRADTQPYSNWAAEGFTTAERSAGEAAPGNDPDRDGWPNLLEYTLGTDPCDPHSRPQPSFQTDPAFATCDLAPETTDAGLRLLVSDDLTDWQPANSVSTSGGAVTAPLGSCRFIRVEAVALPGLPLDSDGDGLHDLFEEQLVLESAGDALHSIGDVAPLDDFDGDGTPNIDEAANQRPTACGFPTVPLLDPGAVAAAVDTMTPKPTQFSVHTQLH